MSSKKEPGLGAEINVSARITRAEKAALDKLLERRVAELEGQGIPGDATFSGWLRAAIRRESAARGIQVEYLSTGEHAHKRKVGARG